MLVFSDIISGDELFSDGFDPQLVDDIVYEIATKQVTKTDSDDFDIGANPAEGEETEVDVNSVTVNNLVDAHQLMETSFDKKSFQIWIKGYMKAVKAHLEENDPDRVKDFMSGAAKMVKKILGNFKEYQFFTGESMDAEGSIGFLFYKEDGITPYFWFFKDGLKSEKV